MSTTTDHNTEIVRTMLDHHIARMTVLAVSGGRVQRTGPLTITLPVSNGYRVEVEYVEGVDLYTVRRVFVRGAKRWVKGEVDRVYCDQLDEVVYLASCFRNVDFGEDVR